MKIGAIIPTRGDRPQLLNFALRQLDRQTRKVDLISIVDDPPSNSMEKDITKRYRLGSERISDKVDVAFLIEDDDYYDPEYIFIMMEQWENHGKPEIFGIGTTFYYHLALRGFNQHLHSGRASAFCTMVTSEGLRKMRWPKDNYAFTDIELWKVLVGKTFMPSRPIAIGIKGHQNGTLFGGMGHSKNAKLYTNNDHDMSWFKKSVDEESYLFYGNISNIVGNKILLQ